MAERPQSSPYDNNQGSERRVLASLIEPLTQQLVRSLAPLIDFSELLAELLAPIRTQLASIFDSPGFRELIAQWQESLPRNWSESERADHIAEFTYQTAVCLV